MNTTLDSHHQRECHIDAITDTTSSKLYYHGTRADLKTEDLIVVGDASNFGSRKPMSWAYLTGTLDAAIWGAELAVGEERQRISIVEPTGPIVDDPNLTDKTYPGKPVRRLHHQTTGSNSRVVESFSTSAGLKILQYELVGRPVGASFSCAFFETEANSIQTMSINSL